MVMKLLSVRTARPGAVRQAGVFSFIPKVPPTPDTMPLQIVDPGHRSSAAMISSTSELSESAGGFSLIELLVVMLITFFVSGAIYALIASGQNSFRREPEMADRQQNIRIAMALIELDIESAGAGLPLSTQVFSPALNGVGPEGTIGTPGQAARNGDPSINTDALEIVSTEDTCPALSVCGLAGAVLQTREPLPACVPPPRPGANTDNN